MDIFPVDLTSDVGRVRKYIPDLTPLKDPEHPDDEPQFIFSDDEIQAFVDDHTELGLIPTRSWHIRRAAADAMVAIANSENLIMKKIVTEDLQTDGPAVADKLLKAAAMAYGRADAEESSSSVEEVFYSVPYVHYPPRFAPLGGRF